MKARFARQYRDQVRNTHAPQSWLVTGRIFGCDNVKIGKGQTRARSMPPQRRSCCPYQFADGDGLRAIALTLNAFVGTVAPAQQGV